ncbi:MAG: aromatic acid exporter family protein [Dissulfurispiraceae bacterium]
MGSNICCDCDAANLGCFLSASLNRLLGSAIDAVVGAVWVVILGRNPWSVGIALTLTILLCSYLKPQESYRIAGGTVLLIMLVPGPSP